MGRESPGEVLRSLIESPLAEPRGSLRGAAAPVLDLFDRGVILPCFIRHRRRKARHPPYPSINLVN